ncbi:gas vesicle protein GvpO [Streptomyces sp. NPDC000878]
MELERIPDSTSVLAVYRVTLDADGLLLGYARSRRHTRGQVDRQSGCAGWSARRPGCRSIGSLRVTGPSVYDCSARCRSVRVRDALAP